MFDKQEDYLTERELNDYVYEADDVIKREHVKTMLAMAFREELNIGIDCRWRLLKSVEDKLVLRAKDKRVKKVLLINYKDISNKPSRTKGIYTITMFRNKAMNEELNSKMYYTPIKNQMKEFYNGLWKVLKKDWRFYTLHIDK